MLHIESFDAESLHIESFNVKHLDIKEDNENRYHVAYRTSRYRTFRYRKFVSAIKFNARRSIPLMARA